MGLQPNARGLGAILRCALLIQAIAVLLLATPALAADDIVGQVLGAGAPIAKSTVTLWSAGANAPTQLAQTQTGEDGRFTISLGGPVSPQHSLYLVARGGEPAANKGAGDNPAIALIAVIGNQPPAKVIVNEFTTVASVWTNAQFLDGNALQGNPLGLRIAAGNVPNFVDLATGGYGVMIQDPLNSTQTPTIANFATIADVIAGCVTRVRDDACRRLFAAAAPAAGTVPADTLSAAESIARNSAYKPARLFDLLEAFYPVPAADNSVPHHFCPISALLLAPGCCRSISPVVVTPVVPK